MAYCISMQFCLVAMSTFYYYYFIITYCNGHVFLSKEIRVFIEIKNYKTD